MQANNLEAASNQEVTKAIQPRVNPRHLSCTDFSVEVLTLRLGLPTPVVGWWGNPTGECKQAKHGQTTRAKLLYMMTPSAHALRELL